MSQSLQEIRFSSRAYDLDTLKRAAYRFTGQLAFNFIPDGDFIVCQVSPLSVQNPMEIDGVLNDFKNEVLDQDLRRTIANETAPLRNVILAHVFSKSGLQSGE